MALVRVDELLVGEGFDFAGHSARFEPVGGIWEQSGVDFFGEYIGRITGKLSALNNDKYNILRQRNWRCDISPAIEQLGYSPDYDLERGTHETIAWYLKEGWL